MPLLLKLVGMAHLSQYTTEDRRILIDGIWQNVSVIYV